MGEIYQACVRDEVAQKERLLINAQQEADMKRAKGCMRVGDRLIDDHYGLKHYVWRLVTKSSEDNVDKLFAIG